MLTTPVIITLIVAALIVFAILVLLGVINADLIADLLGMGDYQ